VFGGGFWGKEEIVLKKWSYDFNYGCTRKNLGKHLNTSENKLGKRLGEEKEKMMDRKGL